MTFPPLPDDPDCWPLGQSPLLGAPLPSRMHALTIRRDRYGIPREAIRLERVPVPRLCALDARRVLVAILATGPNFNTNFASLGLPVPVFGRGDAEDVHVPGSDALGIVVDAGLAVTRVKAGDAVILDSWTGRNIRGYETHDGFNAQFAVVDEERALPVPGALADQSPERLAALLLTYGTAYRAVVERLDVRPGDSVLVMGGGKGTSFPGAQIAKSLGARVILVGSNAALAEDLVRRGIADAWIDRSALPREVFGPIGPEEGHESWESRTEAFRRAVRDANGGKLVRKVFEHTGGDNFPLLVSALEAGGTLAFFGATGKGLKGEYKETFHYAGHRHVFDARWVWMRQKRILFRNAPPPRLLDEAGLPPGRKVLVWGADGYARAFARAALARSASVAVIASVANEPKGIRAMRRLGIPAGNIIDRDGFDLPGDMPDPLTGDGRPNPLYAAAFQKPAQALGKAIWKVFGPRQSPDVIAERHDGATLHFSAFLLRDFDENDAMPCGAVVARGPRDLSILGSHMYHASQAAEVLRLLSNGRIVHEQEDLDVTTLPGLPALQQKMLDGTMEKPKGVALVQASEPGRRISAYSDAFFGRVLRKADPRQGRFLEIRSLDGTIVVTLTRPDALNALNEDLLRQLEAVVREVRTLGTVEGEPARALVLTGAGRAFVAGADVKEFHGKTAGDIGRLAEKNIAVFSEIENLPIPVVAVVDGFALGGGNELAMSAHYRIVTENASLGQPEVKLGIIPGYGGMQRLPRLVGPRRAARMCVNGEPVGGREAVAIGLADRLLPSSLALLEGVRTARAIASGAMPPPRKGWDELAAGRRDELDALFRDPVVRGLLAAPFPDGAAAGDISAARRAAARAALEALRFGFERGFSEGLRNDAAAFGRIAASPGGQTWVGRFLAKDPAQSSWMCLFPEDPSPDALGIGEPITKKAPGDRTLSADEIRATAALISAKEGEGKVRDLPESLLRALLRGLRETPAPPLLGKHFPSVADRFGANLARRLRKGEIALQVVDLGDAAGFPRENARPTCEVLLLRGKDGLHYVGKRRLERRNGETPVIFLTEGFLRRTAHAPGALLQAVVHPLIEWVYGLPHMVAVLSESAFNGPETQGIPLSDLNRFIALEAGRDRDLGYIERILGTPYEPDELRIEELRVHFPSDEGRIAEVVSTAQAAGRAYRALLADICGEISAQEAQERIRSARKALDEGDADRALQSLRKIAREDGGDPSVRDEALALIRLSIESLAHDADPSFEGVRLESGTFAVAPWAGVKAHAFGRLLQGAAECLRRHGGALKGNGGEARETDFLAEKGTPREVHVIDEMERPSAKFIDGHDVVHWVFDRAYVDMLLGGAADEEGTEDVRSAFLACRFVRDGVFPDEKLKVDRQFTAAVRGAIEGYRFYQALPEDLRGRMEAFHEERELPDRLHRLFRVLGGETNPARASHIIRREVARTHSYNFVRYPDTSLAGQVVVITGGGTGMGRALALEAAKAGANVVITGRRPEPLEETRADLEDLARHLGLTNQILSVQGDVGDPKYVGEMFERIEREFGRIDLLFNNAGVSGPVEFGSAYRDELFEQYRETVHIHLTGSWLASLEAARVMERQPAGGVIVMVGTFYSESIHPHVLHAYPGRLPYTSAQSAKLALGDYLAWALAGRNISVLSINPSAVSTDRLQRGAGVFDKGSKARSRIGRNIPPESLERETLDRTVSHEFVQPRDFARVALETNRRAFRRTLGGQRLPMGGVTYEQPPGVIPSPARLHRYPDLVGKVALMTLHGSFGSDMPLYEATAGALARAGASVVLASGSTADAERISLGINSEGGEGMATVAQVRLSDASEVQELFAGLPRLDLLVHFTGGVDWKRPLLSLPYDEWTATIDRFGLVPRMLCWHAERRMDRDGTDGTIVVVGPDLSGVPSIRERRLVQVFQAMLRPAIATEGMERALMRKAQSDRTSPAHVSAVNIALVLPGRTDGRNRQADPEGAAATVLWLADEGKNVSGATLLPDEQGAVAGLPPERREERGTVTGKVAVVTGGIRNLGREISLRFAREGGTVVAASRKPRPEGASPEDAGKARAAMDDADAALARMRASGGRALWIDADVSRPSKVKAVIDETVNRFGRIDVFVNNAGAGGDFSTFGEVLRDHRRSWEDVLRANFLGPLCSIVLLRDVMRKQPGGGAIVNVSTHYADHPYLFRTIYTTSKIMLKSLTQALAAPLAKDNIRIADVAPSLIAGPRMDWVMANYAGKFAARFDAFGDLRPPERTALREGFIKSFDRTLPPEAREAARAGFLSVLGETGLPRKRRSAIEEWYGKIREWFRSTVPDDPPSNEEVADAVLFAAKEARYLEEPFVRLSTLPPFVSFPPPEAAPAPRIPKDGCVAFLSAGRHEGSPEALETALARAFGSVAVVAERPDLPGHADIRRHAPGGGRAPARRSPETVTRSLDLSDPRILEPWLDNSLHGGPPPSAAVVLVGTAEPPGTSLLSFSTDRMEGFLAHATKVLNVTAEAVRAVRERGTVLIVAPPEGTGEGAVLRAALRQMVRTRIAEQWFLPAEKTVRLGLVSAPRRGEWDALAADAVRILAGERAAPVEPVPVNRERP